MNQQEAQDLDAYMDSVASQVWDFETFKKILRETEPYHYVPFMTGYETDQPFIAACGRDVTCGFFYTSLHTFIGMPAVVPIRRCRDCEDMVGAGATLGALMALLALSTPSRAPERRPRPSGSCAPSPPAHASP